MKFCLFLLACVCFFAFMPAKDRSAKTVFYFCISRPINKNVQAKQTIFYTGIQQMETEDALTTKLKAKEWGTIVSARCASSTGCTSDLNYYPSREKANTVYAQTLQMASDTSRFILQKVTFQ